MIAGQVIGDGEFTDRFIAGNLLYSDNPYYLEYESVRHDWDHAFGLYSEPTSYRCPVCERRRV